MDGTWGYSCYSHPCTDLQRRFHSHLMKPLWNQSNRSLLVLVALFQCRENLSEAEVGIMIYKWIMYTYLFTYWGTLWVFTDYTNFLARNPSLNWNNNMKYLYMGVSIMLHCGYTSKHIVAQKVPFSRLNGGSTRLKSLLHFWSCRYHCASYSLLPIIKASLGTTRSFFASPSLWKQTQLITNVFIWVLVIFGLLA